MASAPLAQGYVPATSDDGESLSSAAGGIVMRLLAQAQEQVRQRRAIEQRWLEDLRAYHGRYDVQTEGQLSGKKRSRAFINLPRAKTNAWDARLGDLLFPADGKNWGIQPTPVPELAQEATAAVDRAERQHAAAAAKVEQANQIPDDDPTRAEEKARLLVEAGEHGGLAVSAEDEAARVNAEMDEARKRATAMEKEIEDQLVECRFPQRARDIISDAVKLGVGIIKGPFVANRTRRSWVKDPDEPNVYHLGGRPGMGGARPGAKTPRPAARRVDPWAFFPQMNATDMADAEFAYERHLPSRAVLRKMAKSLDFDPVATRRLIMEGPGQSSADLDHLTQLRGITGEGESITDRFVVWEYHGPLESDEIATLLRAMGDIEAAEAIERDADPLNEHMVVAWFSGTTLLKLHPEYSLDSGESLYSVFSFEKGEASIMGAIGIPRIVYDGVAAANAAWRMMLDNAALSVGPQIVVDKALIQPENNDWNLAPMKVWKKVGQEIAGAAKPFEVFNIPMNQAQLAGIIELALKFIDEEAALPMLSQGEQGTASPTMGGMTMLFNAASVVFRRVVRNWDDDLTEPLIRRFYDWNMQFSDKDAIKGDLQVKAQGTAVLLVREMMAMQLAGIVQTWTTHPVLATFLKNQGFEAAMQFLQSLSLNPAMILDEWPAVEARLKAMQEAGAQSPEVIRAQASIQVATISAESRAAEGATTLEVAEINREIELIRLASQEKMTVGELETRLAIKKVETDSKERIFAGELGFEAQNAADARARGEEPEGSGGYVSAGDGV